MNLQELHMHIQMSLIIPIDLTLNSLAPLISQTSLFWRLLLVSIVFLIFCTTWPLPLKHVLCSCTSDHPILTWETTYKHLSVEVLSSSLFWDKRSRPLKLSQLLNDEWKYLLHQVSGHLWIISGSTDVQLCSEVRQKESLLWQHYRRIMQPRGAESGTHRKTEPRQRLVRLCVEDPGALIEP